MSKKIKWEELERGVYLVNVLGVIYNPKEKKILIGKRENDEYVPELGWCFPGGRPEYGEDLEEGLKREIEKKTGLKIESLGSIFSRVPDENDKFILIYYLCEKTGGEGKAGEKFTEIKWVKPEELEEYFKTSFDPRLKEYIENLK
jgi:ADP-ribose pyrophosphatase YjhB (NUDIX family)